MLPPKSLLPRLNHFPPKIARFLEVSDRVVFEVNGRGWPKNRILVEGVGEIDDLELG